MQHMMVVYALLPLKAAKSNYKLLNNNNNLIKNLHKQNKAHSFELKKTHNNR